jgi:hypothetical protein
MATVLEEFTTEYQHSVVRFFFCGKKDLVQRIFIKKCFLFMVANLSGKAVHILAKKFSQGRSKVADDAQIGHPVETAREATVQQVEDLIRAEGRITMVWSVPVAHLQKRGENVSSASYCEVLLTLQDAIRRRRPDQLA